MKDFREVYQFPFILKFPDIGWVYDSNDNFIFQFNLETPLETMNLLIDVINGKDTLKIDTTFEHLDGEITIKDKEPYVVLIRGWGNLTSEKGFNTTEALGVQESLAEYITQKLNYRENGNKI